MGTTKIHKCLAAKELLLAEHLVDSPLCRCGRVGQAPDAITRRLARGADADRVELTGPQRARVRSIPLHDRLVTLAYGRRQRRRANHRSVQPVGLWPVCRPGIKGLARLPTGHPRSLCSCAVGLNLCRLI